MIYQARNRTNLKDIIYSINLYCDGLSLRKTFKMLSWFVMRSHTGIRDWIQKSKPQRLLSQSKKISEFIIDETLIKVGSEYVWLSVTIAPKNSQILAVPVSRERNMLIAEKSISDFVMAFVSILFQTTD